MGTKMAWGTGLDARQEQFLAVVLQEPYILKNFYLSGGTALSSWYLHHRESYDLDFFSEKFEVNAKYIAKIFQKNQKKIGYKKIVYTEQLGFNFYNLEYPDDETLKIDFSYYPSERVENGILWKGLHIDSLYDICLNKYETIVQSPRAKDYVDLFFISKDIDLDFKKIRRDAAIKFGIQSDVIHIAKQFLKVVEFKDVPKMLVSFDRKEMEDFFLQQAKELGRQIFK